MISTDLHSDLAQLLQPYQAAGVFWVTDEQVMRAYSPMLAAMQSTDNLLVLPAGEQCKTLESITKIWGFLHENNANRQSLLVCFGGGVITDLGGFAAGTFKRGIAYLNIPTTLLAMVDASTGGKTGFNFHGLKNEIGLFNPPIETLIYAPFLQTLPYKELLSGYGEIIKTAMLSSGFLLEKALNFDLVQPNWVELSAIIEECLSVKETIVARDPLEIGERKALNLGHTIGHALESFSHSTDEPLLHGEAVAYGLLAELYISLLRHDFPAQVLSSISDFVRVNYGKYALSCGVYEQLYELMLHDKKNRQQGEVVCTLLRNVGKYEINAVVSKEDIFAGLDYLFNM